MKLATTPPEEIQAKLRRERDYYRQLAETYLAERDVLEKALLGSSYTNERLKEIFAEARYRHARIEMRRLWHSYADLPPYSPIRHYR